MSTDKSYWNEKYWVRHMRDDDLDNIEDPWIEKYTSIKCYKVPFLILHRIQRLLNVYTFL